MKIAMGIDPREINAKVKEVLNILKQSDDLHAIRVCNMYMDLCRVISDNIVPDTTSEIVERLERERQLRDNIDRPYRNNVTHANRPSEVQEKLRELKRRL